MRTLLATLALVLTPSVALTGGFEVAEQSAAATGTANAGTARGDNPAAAWFNPAALADGGGLRLGVGLSLATSAVHSEALDSAADGPWSADTKRGLSTPPYLHASYAQGDWAAALSINVPFGSSIVWPEGWAQRFDIISSKPMFFRVAPSFAWSFGAFRIAAGGHFDTGKLDIVKATNHIADEGTASLSLRGSGFGFDLAAFVAATDELSLGVSYKSRTRLSLSGNADFEVPQAFAGAFPDQSVSASWTLPDRVAVGATYQLGDVSIVGDLSATLWSVNDELAFDFSDEATEDTAIVNQWRDTVALRLGAEWQPAEGWFARGGAFVDGLFGAPPPQERLSPSSPDSTRLGFTLGGGKQIGPVAVDLFYEHLRLLKRSASGADAPLASYSGSAHLFGLGARYTY